MTAYCVNTYFLLCSLEFERNLSLKMKSFKVEYSREYPAHKLTLFGVLTSMLIVLPHYQFVGLLCVLGPLTPKQNVIYLSHN